MNQATCRRILIPTAVGIVFLCLFFLLPAFASEDITYVVSFVDTEDINRQIFHAQRGTVSEGESVSVSFPEKIIGSDGYIWQSLEQSPQIFEVNQSGTHKYYIEYKKGKKTVKPEDNNEDKKAKLERWLQTAWEADCTITGRDVKGQRDPFLITANGSDNDNRLKNLISMIDDANWHYFYMIGKNYVPQTLATGAEFDTAYSAVTEEVFSVEADRYHVIKVGVRRNWKQESCRHDWIVISDTTGNGLSEGVKIWRCSKCGSEEAVHMPAAGEAMKPHYWKEGEVQIRKIGHKNYRFTCVDEDYSDNREGHRKAALFLCDRVIRSDIDSSESDLEKFSFGEDNNYKTSKVRAWLAANTKDAPLFAEPIYMGVNTAYTGSTIDGNFEQMVDSHLISHEIGFQLMQDQFFCLSLEEALKYRDLLWRFNGSELNNPESQLSPYSVGYYLRTPFYTVDEAGIFQYSKDIYVVDLAKGNIHTAESGSETYGLRPAFALPQE